MTTTTIVIHRDGERREYTVPVGEYTTILDALEHIRGEEDPSLLYRHSCHHGSCGTCGVIANGERVLGCTTRLQDLDRTVELFPLAPFPVIGDLAVEPAPLYQDFPSGSSIRRPSEALPDATPPPEVSGYVRFENCIECGLCEAVCPVVGAKSGGFKGPAALASYGREIEKNPDREDELLAQIDTPDGVWGCDRALNCSATCPLGVAPARHIAVLRRRIERRNSPV